MMENIRLIKTGDDYDWALQEVAAYFENEPETGTPDGDRFQLLLDLVEAYEAKHYPIDALDPITAISAYMELTGHTQKELAILLGSAPRASEILNKHRALTMEMVFKLNKAWGIPAETLIQPYHLSNKS
jgi:HTH-type transcriptional regulator/antitoxin HigA